jgi:ribosomal protein S20
MYRMNRKLVAAGVAAVAVIGGSVGGAIAASSDDSPAAEKQAFLDDAAKRLNVSPQALESALQDAAKTRIDAAVAAGRLSKDEGDRLKAAIDAGRLPLFFGGPGRFVHPGVVFGVLRAAADYLGLTPEELIGDLRSGKSLADVASAQGKTVDGLKQAIVAAARSKLDEAVKSGRLSADQESQLLARLQSRLDDLVDRAGLGPAVPPPGGLHPFRPFWSGPSA